MVCHAYEPVIEGKDVIERGSDRGDFDLRTYGVTSEYPLKYESEDESILTVNENGYVQLNAAGETVIKVTTEDQQAVKLITVRILKRNRPSLRVRYCSDYEGDLSASKVIELTNHAAVENSAFTNAYLAVEDSNIDAGINCLDDYSQINTDGVITFDETILNDSSLNLYTNYEIKTAETDLYLETDFSFVISILRKEREMYFKETDISAKMTDVGYQLHLICRPYDEVTYYSSDSKVATVDQFGYVTFKGPGEVNIDAWVQMTNEYRQQSVSATITIAENRQKQFIQNVPPNGVYKFTYEEGKELNFGLTAYTPLTYNSWRPDIATVDSNGTIRFSKPGTAEIDVNADASSEYFDAGRIIVVVAEDPAVVAAREEEEARQKAAEEARLKAEEEARQKAAEAAAAAQNSYASVSVSSTQTVQDADTIRKLAKSLKRPKLKCKRKKKSNKLSWNKISGASGYELYVQYPGSKKFVKVLNKSSRTKSVTHKGLTKGRVYKYKIRPYILQGNNIIYGKFSNTVKAKVK